MRGCLTWRRGAFLAVRALSNEATLATLLEGLAGWGLRRLADTIDNSSAPGLPLVILPPSRDEPLFLGSGRRLRLRLSACFAALRFRGTDYRSGSRSANKSGELNAR
jgi:hypothetical protein